MGRVTFVLGGARSGKSRFARDRAAKLAARKELQVVYLATATVEDEEMKLRVARHRLSRPSDWRTVEEPRQVSKALESCAEAGIIIVDCLTLFVANLLHELGADKSEAAADIQSFEARVSAEIVAILKQCRRIDAQVLLISNEVGMAVVPPTPLGRLFRDIAGRVNQVVAEEADEVFFLVAGLARKLK